MKSPALPIVLLPAVLFLVAACDERARQIAQEQALLETRLQERLDMGRQVRREECERRLLDSALYIVDSIRLLEVKLALDTVNRPHKPFKPENPGPGVSIDSLEIKPLLPDSLIK